MIYTLQNKLSNKHYLVIITKIFIAKIMQVIKNYVFITET
jgi:hypothetical protein